MGGPDPARRSTPRKRKLVLLSLCAAALLTTVSASAEPRLRARYSFSPAQPPVGVPTVFDASRTSCGRAPCAYRWTAKAVRTTRGGRTRPVALTVRARGGKRTATLGKRRTVSYRFSRTGTYYV